MTIISKFNIIAEKTDIGIFIKKSDENKILDYRSNVEYFFSL